MFLVTPLAIALVTTLYSGVGLVQFLMELNFWGITDEKFMSIISPQTKSILMNEPARAWLQYAVFNLAKVAIFYMLPLLLVFGLYKLTRIKNLR